MAPGINVVLIRPFRDDLAEEHHVGINESYGGRRRLGALARHRNAMDEIEDYRDQ
jgi:hypothetical protein